MEWRTGMEHWTGLENFIIMECSSKRHVKIIASSGKKSFSSFTSVL